MNCARCSEFLNAKGKRRRGRLRGKAMLSRFVKFRKESPYEDLEGEDKVEMDITDMYREAGRTFPPMYSSSSSNSRRPPPPPAGEGAVPASVENRDAEGACVCVCVCVCVCACVCV